MTDGSSASSNKPDNQDSDKDPKKTETQIAIMREKFTTIIKKNELATFISYSFMNIIGIVIFLSIVILFETDIVNYLLPSITLAMHTVALIICVALKNTQGCKSLAGVNLTLSGLVSVCYLAWLVLIKHYIPFLSNILVRFLNCYASETALLIAGYFVIVFILVASLLCVLNNWIIFKSIAQTKPSELASNKEVVKNDDKKNIPTTFETTDEKKL